MVLNDKKAMRICMEILVAFYCRIIKRDFLRL